MVKTGKEGSQEDEIIISSILKGKIPPQYILGIPVESQTFTNSCK
jgi:hypothetical protein